MSERAEKNIDRSFESGGDSWRARFSSRPVETAGLLSVAVEQLSQADRVPLTRLGTTSVGKLIEAISIPMLLIDRSLRIAFANKACRKSGLDRGNFVGCHARTMFPNDNTAQRFQSLMQDVFEHGKPLVVETSVCMGTNEMQVRVHVHAVRIGRKRLLLVFVEDPTHEQRRGNLSRMPETRVLHPRMDLNDLIALETKSQRGLERLFRGHRETATSSKQPDQVYKSQQNYPFDATSDAIVLYDVRGRAMYTNDAFTRLFGGTLQRLSGEEMVFLKETPEDTAVSKILGWIADSAAHRQFLTIRHAQNGSEIPVNVRASHFTDQEGNPAGMMLLLQDESQHKHMAEAFRRSEETAHTHPNASDDAIVLVDTQGFVLASNEEFAGRVGLPVDRFVGKNLLDFFPEHLVQDRVDRGMQAIETGKPVRFSDQRDGRRLENIVCPLFDRNGKVERLAVVSRDITGQDDKVGKLQGPKDDSDLASRAKSEFLANVSHELRTPLNAIIGFSEILEDQLFGELNEKQKAYVGHVLSSGRQLLQLINNILDLASVESGEMELRVAGVDIRHVLESCMLLIKERAQKNGLETRLQVAKNLANMRIEADQTKLKQILFNLLSNAIKFTPPGGEIVVHAEKQGDEVIVRVSDTGIGLKPEDQDRVFGAFEQADSSHTRRHQGTGLGLALTRKMVELHGGRIWVESQGEGHGSTFAVAIPVCAPLPQLAEMR